MYLIKSSIDILPVASFSLAVAGFLPQIYETGFIILYKKPFITSHLGNSTWIIWMSSSVVYGVYCYFLHQYILATIQLIFTSLFLSVFILRLIKPTLITIPLVPSIDISDLPSHTIIDIADITEPNSDFNGTV